jgi:hypothetical protein
MTDTSDLYRQMCDTPEIQKLHEREGWNTGDCISCADGIDFVGNIHEDSGIIKGGSSDYDFVLTEPFVFLPDIRWYLERIPKPYEIRVDGLGFVITDDGDGSSFFHINGGSLETALLKTCMMLVHHKRWKEGKWVGI